MLEKSEFRAFYDAAKDDFREIKGLPDIDDFDAVFDHFDTNKNGSVDKAEMMTILMKCFADEQAAAAQ